MNRPKLTGKFLWYDEQKHQVVCPFIFTEKHKEDIEETICQLKQLEVEILGEIEFPLDIDMLALVCQLPPNLQESDDDGAGTLSFEDVSNKLKGFQIVFYSPMFSTYVYTRYHPGQDEEGRFMVPTVNDATKDEPVWQGPDMTDTLVSSWSVTMEAVKWLDKNKPDWKNPLAYWNE